MSGHLPDDAAVLMRLQEARHSCRAFLPDPVPRETIERMLAMAQRAASWCNMQPWRVIVTEPLATDQFREALHAHAMSTGQQDQATEVNSAEYAFPPGYSGIFKARQRESGIALYQSVGVAKGDRAASALQAMRNFALFDAPHVLILTAARDLGVYGAIDCGGYAANLMLAAQSLGVATISQAALAKCTDFICDYFAISADQIFLFGISFGFADMTHPANGFRTTRAGLEEVVSWGET